MVDPPSRADEAHLARTAQACLRFRQRLVRTTPRKAIWMQGARDFRAALCGMAGAEALFHKPAAICARLSADHPCNRRNPGTPHRDVTCSSTGFPEKVGLGDHRNPLADESVKAGGGGERHRCRIARVDDGGRDQDRSAEDRAVMVGGRPGAAVHGVWRSRGYGYVVRIDPDGPSCFTSPANFATRTRGRSAIRTACSCVYRPWGADAVAFSSEPGQTRYIFDRLPDLPQACTDPTPWSRPRIAALMAATFADLYPSFAERGIDWRARAAAALRALNGKSSDAALFKTSRPCWPGSRTRMSSCSAKVAGKRAPSSPATGVTLGRMRAARKRRMTARARAAAKWREPTSAASSTPCCRAKDIRPRTTA